jgi:hypothetical protein
MKTVDGESESALAPFLDLLNHTSEAETSAEFDETSRCYVLKTVKPYRRYRQVFIKYGHYCNRQLLVNYGFTVPQNPIMDFKVNIAHFSELIEESNLIASFELFQEVGLIQNNLIDFVVNSDGLEWKLDALIKVLSLILARSCSMSTIKDMLFDEDRLLETKLSIELRNKLINVLLSEYLKHSSCIAVNLLEDEIQFLKSLLTQL